MQDTLAMTSLDTLTIEAQARTLRAAHMRQMIEAFVARLRGTPAPVATRA